MITRVCKTLALLVLCGGCSTSPATRPPGSVSGVEIPAADSNARIIEGGTGSAQVTYQPNVRVLDREEALGSLMAVSDDGTTLLFDSPAPALDGLKAGDVLVFKRLFACKVLAVQVNGSERAVLIAPPSLGEVVRDGTITLNTPIRFSRTAAAMAPGGLLFRRLSDLLAPPAYAQASALPGAKSTLKNFEKDTALDRLRNAGRDGERQAAKTLALNAVEGVFSGWHVSYKATPASDGVHLDIRMTKSAGGFLGLIIANGVIGNFDLTAQINIDGGVLQQLETRYSGIQGVMNFEWEIAKETPGGFSEEDRIKLPAALTIPLYRYLDGFPLFLEVSAAAIVQPMLTGGQQYSSGAFRVRYDGRQGVTVREGKIDSEGNVTGQVNFLHDRHVSAIAPVAMVVNVAAPRIELTLNPYKMLGDVLKSLNDVSLFDQIAKASTTANKMGTILAKGEQWFGKRLEGQERVNKTADALKSGSGLMKDFGTIVRSDAAAYIQLVTTSASRASGASAILPCSHTDLAMALTVGASAQAIGQKVGSTSKTIFEHKLTRVDPPQARACQD